MSDKWKCIIMLVLCLGMAAGCAYLKYSVIFAIFD